MKKESDFDFNNLFKKKDKLVFLIGAGCSVDSPCAKLLAENIAQVKNYLAMTGN